MNESIHRFVEDRAALSEAEALDLVAWLEARPAELDQLRGQLVLDEMLSRRSDEARAVFVARVHAALPAAAMEPSPAFVERVQQRAGLSPKPSKPRWQPWLWTAAAALVMMGFVFIKPEPSRVRLVSASGEVHVWRDQVTVSAGAGYVLKAGDWLLTGKDGAAEIEFPGETTRLQIGAEAEFGVVAALPSKELKLTAGTLTASVARQSASHPMMIRTPTAKAEVLGTEFEMNATKERTQMVVTEGRVLIARTADENGVVVEAQHTASVTEQEPVKIAAAPVAKSLDTGLLAHWKFDGDVTDATARGRHLATAIGAAWSPGRIGQALDLHTAQPQVEMSHIELPTVFSVSFWLKIEPGVARAQYVLSCDGRDQGSNAFWLAVPPTHPGSGLVVDVSGASMGSQAFSKPGVIRVALWHHVVAIVDSTEGTARFFVDGIDQSSTSGLRRGFNISGPLIIGRRVHAGTTPFDGQLDDLRIYDRALKPSEISELAGGGARQ
jgi:Concanavalin A-like lectin/glucanases superfamily/FecR protein